MDTKKETIIEWINTIVIALIIGIIVESFLFSFAVVKGESMFPTLETDNRLIVSKLSRFNKEFNKGDLIIFYPPNTDNKKELFIKRIIAKENDHFLIDHGVLYINGERQIENYTLLEEYIPRNYTYVEGVVPPNTVFVMGDNRNDSSDSRTFGFVPIENVKGKVLFKIWPLNEVRAFINPD